MREIEIGAEHNLPYGYHYRKFILSPIGEIDECESEQKSTMNTKTMARVDINWKNGNLIIDIYPIIDIFPEITKAIKYKFFTQPHIFRVKKYRNRYTEEKLHNIIY